MPYAVEPQDGKFAVVNKDTGKVFGVHATRAKAEAQMRALYANAPDDASKSGARNNRRDKLTIQNIKAQAQAIAEMCAELEPDEAGETAPDDENAEVGEGTPAMMNMAYAKSLGLTLPADTLAVKSIGVDEIRGYSHLWGNPSLTDIEAEYFTKSSNFWDDALGKFQRPLTWDHAQDATFKASPIIGSIVDFGDDEIGRWMVAKLDRAHRYRKAVDALIEAGKLGVSSDSAPQYVERVKTGKSTWLKTWPFFAAALTDQPCEPRMLTDGSPEFLKSLGIVLPDAPDSAREFEVLQLRAKVLHIKGV